ncbi:MAG: methionyl-tRNA formyltransferase [Bacillota bacterium]
MDIVFMGTPEFAVPTLRSLAEAGYNISAVITQPDRPRGRGKKVQPSPVKEAALELGIPVLQPDRVRDESFISFLKGLKPDLIVVVAFGRILPAGVLQIPPLGCVNVHSSLLPKYRGAAPMQRAIMNGETETGVTTMMMDTGMDTGDILLRSRMPIDGDDNFGTVHDRLSHLGASLLLETVELLAAGKLAGVPQDHSQATYAPPITREDEVINWNRRAEDIKNQVRALDPWPGARTTLGDRVLKVWKTGEYGQAGAAGDDAAPGQVLGSVKGGLAVMCGDRPVLIRELQAQGGKRMGAADFLRGCRVDPGLILG